jgi:DNA repair protein RecN (Recombination protein N)
MVRPGADKAQVEALFSLPDGEYVLRRELMAESGRSRVSINDQLSSQEKIRNLRPRLVLHTSQHEQQRLLKPAFHNEILDSMLAGDLLSRRDDVLDRLRRVQSQRRELEDKAGSLRSQREFLEYQKQEIEKVDPHQGEEEELEASKQSIKEQARVQESVGRAQDLLHGPDGGLVDRLSGLQREVSRIAEADEEFSAFAEQLEEACRNLADLEAALRQKPLFGESEQELERIESRLWELSRLKRKLDRPLSAIVNLHAEIDENLSFLDRVNLELSQLEKQEEELAQELSQAVEDLNWARREQAETTAERLKDELSSLGFSRDVQVVFHFQEVELHPGITELRGRLMWVPNPGQQPQPLDQIASGGELSRFLLALIGLLSKKELPTLLFDEVDAGIGGIILGQVGERIRELAGEQQVILISHWPQLACLADRHFQVHKEIREGETFTRCSHLGQEQILDELTRMAGGGEHGRLLAEQLMEDDNQ